MIDLIETSWIRFRTGIPVEGDTMYEKYMSNEEFYTYMLCGKSDRHSEVKILEMQRLFFGEGGTPRS